MSVNLVILAGYLGADPEYRAAPGGTHVTTFRLATNHSEKQSDGTWGQGTEWHRCVCFGKTAETIGKHCVKGQLIHAEGRLKTRSYENSEGEKRWSTEIIVYKFAFLGGKPKTSGYTRPPKGSYGGPPDKTTPRKGPPGRPAGDFSDDDIPF